MWFQDGGVVRGGMSKLNEDDVVPNDIILLFKTMIESMINIRKLDNALKEISKISSITEEDISNIEKIAEELGEELKDG